MTVDEIKSHLRVDGDDSDAVLTAYLTAARVACENLTRRSFITQTWELALDAFITRTIYLPRPMLQQVEYIKYFDVDNVEQTVSATVYDVAVEGYFGRVRCAYNQSWPDTYPRMSAVKIRYQSGYGHGVDDVPMPIRQAIKLLTGHFYENREAAQQKTLTEIPFAVNALLAPYVAEMEVGGC